MNKKVLKRRINYIFNPITDYILKERNRRVNQYADFYERLPIRKRTILYESRDGNSMTDSPYAMFRYMLEHPDFQGYTHIWSIQDFDALELVIRQYKGHPHVKFVRRNSREYLRFLASCEYLINNSTFQSFYIPKKEQIYINTWHGTPLKHMGFDIPGDPSHSQNVLRNFLSTDYMLSPNSHTTKIFTDSYKLNGLYEGKIIEEGYPRIDLTLNTDPKTIQNQLTSHGLKIDPNKQNILYAPTWKGTDVSKVNNDVLQISADIAELEKRIGDQYNLLLKVHPFLYKEATKYGDIHDRLIPDYIDTNELLSAIDLLITDYSSIFFDFLVTNKPILFYTWDLDVYNEQRGQYLPNSELPGPLLFNVNELANAIERINEVQATYKEKYESMQKRFTAHDDGNVTERVIQYLFNKSDEKLNVIGNLASKKRKILIYPGGMRNNGITSSFLNLMNNIDHEQYDVTCFTATPHSAESLQNLAKLNKNVRMLFKPGLPALKFFELYKDKFIHNRGKRGRLGDMLFPEEAYVREHRRLFGKTNFDCVIDFSGYSLYWAKFLLAADAKRKICFMHNDLLSDSEKVINGKRPHRINLRGLFSVYNQFDKLVSVSKGTMELNRKNLSQYAPLDKFDYVLNSINPEKILQVEEIVMAETEQDAFSVENFKARAVIKDGSKVWNTLPTNEEATTFSVNQNLEVMITRKAVSQTHSHYKLNHNHQVLGWIESKAVELLPDSIINEQNVDKIARLARPKGNQIWTKPYKVDGAKRVSASGDYKDVIVDVDKEVQTQRSTYCRISVNGTILGWIDEKALNIYDSCTLDGKQSAQEKAKIVLKRKLIKAKYERQKKDVLKNLQNRALREVKVVKPVFAKIANPEKLIIWTHAYPHWKAEPIAPAKWIEGEIVTIRAVIQTRAGTSYLFYKDHHKMGWLDASAFEVIKKPTLIKERKVSKNGELQLGKNFSVWTKPYGLQGAERLGGFHDGQVVQVDQEAVTQKGTYLHITADGESLGWVNEKALLVKEVFGLEVGGQYIPEPDQENFNFVNMGRLSPEKGQDNLIQAFAEFHAQHPNSKLYILGEGPLKTDLQTQINKLGLRDSVYLLGQVENPFSFLKKCDCFVLSSHYEGQPMVLLEAMTLGMKIMATDIVANRTVLEDGKYGLLVENSVKGLVAGMQQMAQESENFQTAPFDYKYYNEMAMETFYRPLEGE
ncbi:CDP-glycerol glycerophosphotransferase family protein [Bacillus niameyensis]|uniref:CDP-glycerol glycerophosphotransferase family protein n=1 Tax=Bacillus niameyensis TaxID=1522308 RepID=UPI000785B992|nr:CDP-glycerol glycerophosphotransferase family protein [Bacillus niameyensis]